LKQHAADILLRAAAKNSGFKELLSFPLRFSNDAFTIFTPDNQVFIASKCTGFVYDNEAQSSHARILVDANGNPRAAAMLTTAAAIRQHERTYIVCPSDRTVQLVGDQLHRTYATIKPGARVCTYNSEQATPPEIAPNQTVVIHVNHIQRLVDSTAKGTVWILPSATPTSPDLLQHLSSVHPLVVYAHTCAHHSEWMDTFHPSTTLRVSLADISAPRGGVREYTCRALLCAQYALCQMAISRQTTDVALADKLVDAALMMECDPSTALADMDQEQFAEFLDRLFSLKSADLKDLLPLPRAPFAESLSRRIRHSNVARLVAEWSEQHPSLPCAVAAPTELHNELLPLGFVRVDAPGYYTDRKFVLNKGEQLNRLQYGRFPRVAIVGCPGSLARQDFIADSTFGWSFSDKVETTFFYLQDGLRHFSSCFTDTEVDFEQVERWCQIYAGSLSTGYAPFVALPCALPNAMFILFAGLILLTPSTKSHSMADSEITRKPRFIV
jgi:hypothetical protein